MANQKNTRSPIKNLPVRQPGQSLRDRIFDVVADGFVQWFLYAVMFSVACLMLWVQYFSRSIISPIIFTVAAVASIVIALLRYNKVRADVANLRLGRVGEEAVGQYLEEQLRPGGYQVLHDIPGDGFNVDHVVIGVTGIYCVETKTHSKPVKGNATVKYDGSKVTVNGHTPERDPVTQAAACSRWLRDLLANSTGKKFKLQPVVLYPGWYVESSVQWPDVWVMNEKLFASTATRQKAFVDSADVHLVTYHLKRYVIAKTEEERQKNR